MIYKGKLRHSSGCFQGKARELSIAPMWICGAGLFGVSGRGDAVREPFRVSDARKSRSAGDARGCSVTGLLNGEKFPEWPFLPLSFGVPGVVPPLTYVGVSSSL
jgi:hypothetical protein